MKGKILLVFLAVLGLSQTGYATCGQNEVYSECGNNDCQVTCANPSPPSNCNNECCSGCICKPGYFRNTGGHCVPAVECDTCSVNQTFSECGNNGCRNTCTNPTLNTVCDPLPGCFPGCICKEGLLINSNGDCVDPIDCDNCGGDTNKVFYVCGNICPVTCANKDTPIACPEICKIPGECGCRPGLVQDINGKCIHPDDCPTCGPNEFFDCGSACDTECATLGQLCPIVNIKCTERCYCKKGYARDKNGVCIPINKCPRKTCPKNEVWNPRGVLCPPQATCDSYLNPLISYLCAEPVDCIPRCECKEGYVRKTENGPCVLSSTCCEDPNAEVVECPNPCPGGTCEAPEFADCKAPCQIRGCQCKKGFVKNSNGKCIRLSQCPKPKPTPKPTPRPTPKPKCPANEVWSHTCPDCPEQCDNIGKSRCKTTKPGCACISGYVREKKGGKCIKKSMCRKYY